MRGCNRGHLARRVALAAIGIVALALIAGACGSSSSPADSETLPDQLAVTITDEGVSLDQTELQAPAEYTLVVHNDSTRDCPFTIGAFISELDVPAGATRTVTFGTDTDTQVDVGCGDERVTNVLVRVPGS